MSNPPNLKSRGHSYHLVRHFHKPCSKSPNPQTFQNSGTKHTYIHRHAHASTISYIHLHLFTYISFTYIYIHLHTFTSIYIHMFIHICLHMYIYICNINIIHICMQWWMINKWGTDHPVVSEPKERTSLTKNAMQEGDRVHWLIWGFPYMEIPKMDGLKGNSIYKWMIWGYPYFRKPPYRCPILSMSHVYSACRSPFSSRFSMGLPIYPLLIKLTEHSSTIHKWSDNQQQSTTINNI
jgi:hypothetical protein